MAKDEYGTFNTNVDDSINVKVGAETAGDDVGSDNASVTSNKFKGVSKKKEFTFIGLLLLIFIGNRVMFKVMTDTMVNYAFFLGQLTTLIYIPIFATAVWYELKYTNKITEEMKQIPKKEYAIMGLFDATASVLMILGSSGTPLGLQSMLLQGSIPATMILSYIILEKRYTLKQYLGSFIIIAGVVVAFVPGLIWPEGGKAQKAQFVSVLFFFLSTIPSAMSSVYKQIVLTKYDCSANYLQYWIAVFQFFFGFAIMPINTIATPPIPFKEMLPRLRDGAKCLGGINSIVAKVNPKTLIPSCIPLGQDGFVCKAIGGLCKKVGQKISVQSCDSCNGSWVAVAIYMVFNCTYNVLILLVIKYSGATVVYLIFTLGLPIIIAVSTIPGLTAGRPEKFTIFTGAGLIFIIVGIVMYRWVDFRAMIYGEEEDGKPLLEEESDEEQVSEVHSINK